MARRYFKLTNFRNIGLNGNQDNKIIINNSLEKGKLGGVIELIGANNSGKSNVLDAIFEYGQKELSDRDITTLSFNDADREPQVSLVYQDANGIIEHILSKKGLTELFNIKGYKKPELDIEELKNALETVKTYYMQYGFPYNDIVQLIKQITIDGKITDAIRQRLKDCFLTIRNNTYRNSSYRYIYDNIPETIKSFIKEESSQGESYIKQEYNYSYEPNIFKYEEIKIKSNDMVSDINNLNNNLFFKSLFKAIDIDSSEIINGYEQYNKFKNSASLNKMRKMVEQKINKLNRQFNKLYFAESDEYKFTIEIESTKISFGMARGVDEDPIMLEMQSTGFRWFFDLYFNFICSNKLNAGDIIIMDEPATNLHPEGQKELRRFIKDFALKNDLTFIIATHSPFLIDPDNYDELRLISMTNNRSTIDNLFSAVNLNDPDSLLPIKDAMTIKQNVLYDLDTDVVWVEGITDYNYLTMFKKLLGIKNVNFIPYNGNGKTEEETKKILSRLVEIKFHKRGILVDADKQGRIMERLCKDTVFKDRVYTISDVNRELKEIEDLFSGEDKQKYKSLNKDSDLYKKAAYSSVMKNTTQLEDYSEETINNFKQLFKIITD